MSTFWYIATRKLALIAVIGYGSVCVGSASDVPSFNISSVFDVSQSLPNNDTRMKWCHGNLVVLDLSDNNTPSFREITATGSVSHKLTFSLSGTSQNVVFDYDVSPDGSLVFAGQTYSSDGRLASYLAINRPNVSEVQLIQLNPYFIRTLATGSDGTIWTVGFEMSNNREYTGSGVNPNGDVLRHFTPSGHLIGSAFPRTQIRNRLRYTSGFLVVNDQRIGWYSPGNGPGVYVEIAPDMTVTDSYEGIPQINSETNGSNYQQSQIQYVDQVAMTAAGKVFVTAISKGGVKTFELDRSSRSWQRVHLPSIHSDDVPFVVGAQQGALVVHSTTKVAFVTVQ